MRERFEAKIMSEPMSGCWLWTGAYTGKYGSFSCRSRHYLAHRFSWLLYRGEIPAGLSVLHKCDVPCCVNPDHLFLGDQAANIADCVAKGRTATGQRHGMAILTNEDVRHIRESALRAKCLAETIGVSEATISRIKNHRNWIHVR